MSQDSIVRAVTNDTLSRLNVRFEFLNELACRKQESLRQLYREALTATLGERVRLIRKWCDKFNLNAPWIFNRALLDSLHWWIDRNAKGKLTFRVFDIDPVALPRQSPAKGLPVYDPTQIWLHHSRDTGKLRVAPQFIHARAIVPPVVAQCFQRYIDAYLVSELETVGDALGCAVDAHIDTFDAMSLDATAECFARQMDDSQRWIGHGGPPGFLVNRNPDFKRVLGREPVEPKRRQKTDHAVRNAFAGLREVVFLSQVRVRKRVESATYALKLPGIYEAL
jgi:hypothetical protein